jgi:hypothetical protein
MRKKAAVGDAAAAEWEQSFRRLAGKLGVRVE